MYEDFLLITRRDFLELLRFFCRVFLEIKQKIKKIDGEVDKLLRDLRSEIK